MKKYYDTLGIILVIIGLFLIIWGSISYTTYPNLLKIMKEAFATAWIQYFGGFILVLGGYALINHEYGTTNKKK
jgi:hypothetical protein